MINNYLLVLPFAFIAMALLGIWIVSPGKPDKRIHRDYVNIRPPSFVAFPRNTRHGYKTDKHPWDHPIGYPYQVYTGQQDKQVWVKAPTYPGYRLVEDIYSDRLYFVPSEDTPR